MTNKKDFSRCEKHGIWFSNESCRLCENEQYPSQWVCQKHDHVQPVGTRCPVCVNDGIKLEMPSVRGGVRLIPEGLSEPQSVLAKQEGGQHYKGLAIQPVEYIYKNRIGFCEGSAIKYLTRWRDKGGVEDLKKAKHFIEILIEFEASQLTVDN